MGDWRIDAQIAGVWRQIALNLADELAVLVEYRFRGGAIKIRGAIAAAMLRVSRWISV